MSKINFFRGDSYPIEVTIWEDRSTSTPLNLSGSTLYLTVNSEKNPDDTSNQLFSVSGVITDASNGKVEFQPTSGNTNQTPGEYWYDISLVNENSNRTIVKNIFYISQDISKV